MYFSFFFLHTAGTLAYMENFKKQSGNPDLFPHYPSLTVMH